MADYEVVGRETIPDVSSSVGFTSTEIPPTKSYVRYAIIQAIDGNIRFTLDGTTPTASLGLRLLQDASVEVWGYSVLIDFLCIDDSGTAKLEVVYMR